MQVMGAMSMCIKKLMHINTSTLLLWILYQIINLYLLCTYSSTQVKDTLTNITNAKPLI